MYYVVASKPKFINWKNEVRTFDTLEEAQAHREEGYELNEVVTREKAIEMTSLERVEREENHVFEPCPFADHDDLFETESTERPFNYLKEMLNTPGGVIEEVKEDK